MVDSVVVEVRAAEPTEVEEADTSEVAYKVDTEEKVVAKILDRTDLNLNVRDPMHLGVVESEDCSSPGYRSRTAKAKGC